MNKRLLGLGLLAAVSFFSTGCLGRPIQRWRANHPCGICSHEHPLLHPLKTRKAAIQTGPTVGPVVGAPCHGCGAPGYPVGLNAGTSDFVPVAHPPVIGSPYPIIPGGPMVIQSNELPRPMQVPNKNGQ